MEGVALRLFNVYGPGQALSNPYTGVLAIFASRLLNGQPPMIFEDGAAAPRLRPCRATSPAPSSLALEHPAAAGDVFNIGSGDDRSVLEIGDAARQRDGARPDLAPEIIGKARAGDIRHCFADIGKAESRPRLHARAGLRSGTDRTRRMGRDADRRSDRVAEAGSELGAAGAGGMTANRPPSTRRCLVTGGAGFIGSNLADRLARDGHARARATTR